MTVAAVNSTRRGRLRWYIAGLLFLSTVINYIDRQTFSVLGPYLKTEFNWSNSDFALAIIAFRVAYSLGQAGSGPLLDRLGTRAGLTVTVAFYSVSAMATSLASGLASFCTFRFLLGLGESANWPGATKAVSEWFPRRESGWAVALFDSGSSVGAAVAPWLVLTLYHTFGSWRPAFLITGTLGFMWLVLFLSVYRRPEDHPRLSAEEREDILANRGDTSGAGDAPARQIPYRRLLRMPQTWGYVIPKSFTDPVWFFITDWFAIYLVARGFALEETLIGFWVPFLAADFGNFFGGGVSSTLIRRGWRVGNARKAIAVFGTIGMMMLVPTVFTTSFFAIITCFAIATFSYAAFSTVILNLPADIYPTSAVASVSGLGGTGAGIGTIIAIYLTGWVSDHYSFAPILIGASTLPLVALAAMLLLVRNTRDTREGVLNEI